MQGLFNVRQSFSWKQIGSGGTAPYIPNRGVVWRVVTSCNPLLDMLWTGSWYSIPARLGGFQRQFSNDWLYRRVCFYGKLNVLLPGWCWLLYRAALLNDICTNTAPRGWRNAALSEISSSLTNMKLPVDSGITWPYIASTDKQLPAFQRSLTLQSSVQEFPKHSPPMQQSLLCKFPDYFNCQHFVVLTYCLW
jgi:hypothetical protein